MKGKITYSLKPLLTKRPSKVGYRKRNDMPGSSECLRQKQQGGEKSVLRYVRTESMAPKKCCGIFFLCIGLDKYTKAPPPAKKMSSFSSAMITIILSHAIIRIAEFNISTCRSLKLRGWQNCINWVSVLTEFWLYNWVNWV